MKSTALFPILLVFLLQGCLPARPGMPTNEAATNTEIIEPQESPTMENTPLSQGTLFSRAGIRFTKPFAIPGKAELAQETIESPGAEPVSYFQISLGEGAGSLRIYEVAAFEKNFGSFIYPPGSYAGGGAVVFQALEKTLEFQNGGGSRALEVHGQMAAYAANGSIKYAYRGTTSDGRYAVYLEYPVTIDFLPKVDQLFSSADYSDLPIPTLAPDGSNYADRVSSYNELATSEIEAHLDSGITPTLAELDNLISSLEVQAHLQ